MTEENNKRDNEKDKENEGKDKKDEEKDVLKLVLVVIVSGLVLMGISILFEKGTELHYIIRGLGISIIGGALIAWAIGHLLAKRSFLKIFGDMETINKNIRKSFKLIKESEDNGLLKIYAPFDMELKKREPSEFEKDINESLSKEINEIKIYGISLRLFFNNLGNFEQQMRKAFKNMNDNKVNIKVLLVSPDSDGTTQRETAEKEFCDKIRQDLETSIRWLRDNLGNYDKRDEIYDNQAFIK